MESIKPNSDFIYIDIESINNKTNKIDTPKNICLSKTPSRARRKLHKGDILFSMVRPYLKNIALVEEKHEKAIASTGFYVIHPTNIYNSFFLFQLVLTPYVINGLNANMKGDNSPSINNSDINDFLFPVPPLNEQKEIVSKVEKLLALADKYDSAQEALNNTNNGLKTLLKKSILQYAIEGKLVPQIELEGTAESLLEEIQEEKKKLYKEGKIKKKDLESSVIFKGDDNKYYEQQGKKTACIHDEIPFSIPESWRWVRFCTLCNFNLGKTPDKSNPDYWNAPDVPWIKISDMTDKKVIEKSEQNISKYALKDKFKSEISPIGTLIMSFKLTIGRVSILGLDAVHNEAIISIFPYINKDRIIRNYLFNTLGLLTEYVHTTGAIKGKTLNSSKISSMLIPLPPLSEQRRIVSKIEDLFKLLD